MAFMTPVLEDVKGSPGAPERQNGNFMKEDNADGLEEGAQSSRGMADESHKDGLQGPGLGEESTPSRGMADESHQDELQGLGLGGGSTHSQGMADESHQDGLQGLGLGGGSTPSQGMAGHCKNCASKEDKQKEVLSRQWQTLENEINDIKKTGC